ncbi:MULTISPECIES: hypothetical protein [unclassified Actinomyces]|uniref:hypothetical protein n=1 Tax=unclassified Actinomyces TaxID=2609248 RepID=UPI00137B594A|nr:MULTISPECIES: hypothetical protein [unclassified Actinomyces]MBW3069502.1 hypothetical protein [Actinomyces sp. 594]NDR53504.1 hypothetical protein [Actinomyces sp. 565]
MKFNNHDLALRGMLSVLPPHLERYLRNTLANRCTPETLRALLAGSGPVPEFPDLAAASWSSRGGSPGMWTRSANYGPAEP